MKIIKVNEGNEKVKYEIYNMYLNQARARSYREEQAKKLEFYRLQFIYKYDLPQNNGLGLSKYINSKGEIDTKCIYEFDEIPIGEKKVEYGFFGGMISPKYLLRPYELTFFRFRESCSEYINKKKEEGLIQQKEFMKHFEEVGLSDYRFEHLGKGSRPMCSYIFLTSFALFGDTQNWWADNVICLPNEIITMYLLEKGYIEKMHYYLDKIVDLEDEQKLFNCYDFEKDLSFTEKQMKYLLNSGLVKEEELTRKIALDRYITNYIK